jgi:hypothetical protein
MVHHRLVSPVFMADICEVQKTVLNSQSISLMRSMPHPPVDWPRNCTSSFAFRFDTLSLLQLRITMEWIPRPQCSWHIVRGSLSCSRRSEGSS